jgi:hypothetical protein
MPEICNIRISKNISINSKRKIIKSKQKIPRGPFYYIAAKD